MAENSLLSRLDGIDARFEEVSTLITDPSVIADMKRYVRLNKEYKDLERLTSATNRYRALLANIAEAKELLEPADGQELLKAAEETPEEKQPSKPQETKAGTLESGAPKETDFEINTVLGNLKKMEWQEMPIPDLDVGKVKSLLGSLYMEMLFPHNGRYGYFNLGEGEKSVFNRKV